MFLKLQGTTLGLVSIHQPQTYTLGDLGFGVSGLGFRVTFFFLQVIQDARERHQQSSARGPNFFGGREGRTPNP